jgi:hypothetical protein
VGSEPSSCEGSRLTAAPTVVCARTSLAVHTRQNDARACDRRAYALRPHATSCGELKARGIRAARRPRAARTAKAALAGLARVNGRRRLQCSGWAAAAQVAALRAAGDAVVAVIPTTTRDRNCTRTDTAPLPPLLRCTRTYRFRVKRRTGTLLQTRSVHDRGNKTTSARSLLKNPALASGTNAWPPLSGCLLTGRLWDGAISTSPRGRRNFLSGRLGDGHCYFPTSCDARAVVRLTAPCSTRNALTARTKQYGLTSRSAVQRFLSAARLSHVAAYVSSIPMDRCDNYGLAFAARNGRPGGLLPAQSGTIIARQPLGFKAK